MSLVVAAIIAACGGGGSPSRTAASKPGNESAPVGCNQYCQTAGAPGGPLAGKPMSAILTTGTVHPLANGAVPVALRCLYPHQCRGAILFALHGAVVPVCVSRTNLNGVGGIGRGDVVLDADATRTFQIPLSSCGEHLLRARGKLTLDVFANLLQSFCPQLNDPTATECGRTALSVADHWEYFADATIAVS